MNIYSHDTGCVVLASVWCENMSVILSLKKDEGERWLEKEAYQKITVRWVVATTAVYWHVIMRKVTWMTAEKLNAQGIIPGKETPLLTTHSRVLWTLTAQWKCTSPYVSLLLHRGGTCIYCKKKQRCFTVWITYIVKGIIYDFRLNRWRQYSIRSQQRVCQHLAAIVNRHFVCNN